MVKLALLALIGFGCFMALAIFVPGSRDTAFTAFTHPVPWIALGVLGVCWVGYKAIK